MMLTHHCHRSNSDYQIHYTSQTFSWFRNAFFRSPTNFHLTQLGIHIDRLALKRCSKTICIKIIFGRNKQTKRYYYWTLSTMQMVFSNTAISRTFLSIIRRKYKIILGTFFNANFLIILYIKPFYLCKREDVT